MGLEQRCPRVSVADRGGSGPRTLEPPRRSSRHQRTCGQPPSVLQRRLPGLFDGAYRRLPHRHDVCAPRAAGASTPLFLEPPPALSDGPWLKQQKPGNLRTLSTRVGLGAERLPPLGLAMSTAVGERLHLTVRQALAPLGRKT